MSRFLRVGSLGVGIPITITVVKTDLLDPLAVTAVRFLAFREADDDASPGQIWTATPGTATAESIPVTHVTVLGGASLQRDTLYLYAECQIGAVWIPTEDPYVLPVKGHQ